MPGLEVVHVGLARQDRALIVAANEHAAAAARLGPLEADLRVAERLLESHGGAEGGAEGGEGGAGAEGGEADLAHLEAQLGGPAQLRRALGRRAALREAAAAERALVDRTEASTA